MISVEHLTKCYGDFTAVDDLSFEIGEGKVYGFLGPNGAGKSTTMNIITGCLSATSGSVKIGGYDIFEQPLEAKKLIGYLPEIPPLYMNETPREYLNFVAEAKGLKGSERNKDVDRVLEMTGLTHMQGRLISALSKGYKQRVGIAQALLGSPKVIILDEPTVGLDPIQIVEIREMIRELGKTHTIIFSSHILSEVRALCEEVIIIAHGKLMAYDTPENLEKVKSSKITFAAETDKEKALELLAGIKGIENITAESTSDGVKLTLDVIEGTDAKEICADISLCFAEKRIPVYEMAAKKAGLEEIFLELTEDTAADADNAPAEASDTKEAVE